MSRTTTTALLLMAIAAVCLCDIATGSQKNQAFEDYKKKFGKNYDKVPQNDFRSLTFTRNLAKISEHNKDSKKTHTEAINSMADLTPEEYASTRLTLKVPATFKSLHVVEAPYTATALKATTVIDWPAQGKVTSVKDQGNCGSCWAFSAIGTMESGYMIKKNLVVTTSNTDFSEQQLVDCSMSYGNLGCNGGLMNYAFQYIKAFGINTEATYPYKISSTGTYTCLVSTGPYKVVSYVRTTTGVCSSLISALSIRPIAVAVDASNWQFYSSGIFGNCATNLNHGVVLVGYYYNTSATNTSYYRIKNSWGSTWGESGYIKLTAAATNNTCGICNAASYPTF